MSPSRTGTEANGGHASNVHDASSRGTPFTIENLPYGVISTATDPKRRAATALDDSAVDLNVLQTQGVFEAVSGLPVGIFAAVS